MSEYEIIDVIGEDAAIALAEHFGGTRLYIPATVREDHAITEAIGGAATHKLLAHYRAGTVRVPLLREQRVWRYRQSGLSIQKIASRLCMTESGVAKALKRLRDQGS